MIRNCATAGIPAIKYNLQIVGDLRIGRTPGRGDSTYSTWKLAEAQAKDTIDAGRGGERRHRMGAHYVLPRSRHSRGNPIQNSYGFAPGRSAAFRLRATREWNGCLGTVDGLKRFIKIQENPYHGLNFCQGTVSEMLQNPGAEIFDVIRYFGRRDKIFNVHFRNIRGHVNDFVETYPDEGDVDFVKALQTYKEVGYKYMLMPDHVPQTPHDRTTDLQSFAY